MPTFVDFVAFFWPSVFRLFFDAFLDGFLVGFGSPFWLQKSTKIDKNTIPDYILFWTPFLIDFSLIFHRFFIKFSTSESYFGPSQASSISKNDLLEFRSISEPIRAPHRLHFASQNPPKSFKNPSQEASAKMTDFEIEFRWILAPFWEPTWDHVGAQDGPRAAQDHILDNLDETFFCVLFWSKTAPRIAPSHGGCAGPS